MTQRGMGKTEMERIAEIMATVLSDIKNEEVASKAARQVEELTSDFPLYPEL
ncbi:MAG: Serine hydroxymethyltransferase [Actinobacteria bacterium]|nr:Serine hydroxymethyltransferase [Actinomycetota bacterium]